LTPYARMISPSISLNKIDVHPIPFKQKLFDNYIFCFGLFL